MRPPTIHPRPCEGDVKSETLDGGTAPLNPECTCSADPYEYAPCPYDLAIEGEEIECNCCLSCRERCAENI